MSTETLLIHELAERAGTTVRTIRYYTDEALIPQPVIQGKYASYDENHLNRLDLIRRMKDSYLPLREIRQIMNSLSDSEVLQRLQELAIAAPQKTEREPDPEQGGQGSGKNALEYISRVMDEQSVYRPQGTEPPPRSSRPGTGSRNIPIGSHLPAGSGSIPEGETWQRIPLAPGVELCLRTPADANTANQVQQLLVLAKKLFS